MRLSPAEGEAAADLVVRLGRLDGGPATVGGTCFRMGPDEVGLVWPHVGAFRLRGGTEVTVDPTPGVAASVLRLFLLGPALALALQQRGLLVLHASAVTREGGVVAFLGGSGWGKSTTVAALQARGGDLVADDVLAVEAEGPSCPVAHPGVPEVKLWPDAALWLGETPEALPRVHPAFDKRARRADGGLSGAALPVRRLYVLDDGDRPRVEPLAPQEALVELIRHSYAARLLPSLGPGRHLRQCGRVVTHVPVRRLRRPRSLAALPEVAALLERDLA